MVSVQLFNSDTIVEKTTIDTLSMNGCGCVLITFIYFFFKAAFQLWLVGYSSLNLLILFYQSLRDVKGPVCGFLRARGVIML